ncbi:MULTISPECIES: hypothetical protein [unclassified Janibacter]|uniref:hypothetical protein n=1 Tax=unclassified Janibacter TaxID=2649294 RepID=UPI003CFF42A7
MTGSSERTAARWATFAGACVVLLVLVVLLALQLRGPSEPADPRVVVGEARQVGTSWHVPVTLRNVADDTAAAVQVSASLTVDGEEVMAGDQSVDFLSGGEEVALVFVMPQDPADGELAVAVTGFAEP